MLDEQNKQDSVEVQLITEKPLILDKVGYAYVSYAQVAVNTLDFRIAFGDRIPPGGDVKPIAGVVMSHAHAKALLEVLSANVPKIDILLKRVMEKTASKPSNPETP